MASYEWLDRRFRRMLRTVAPALLPRYVYLSKRGRLPNMTRPETFDEKLIWLLLYWKHPLKVTCSDKFAVREYISKQGFGDMLPRIFGVYQSVSEIDLAKLPERFVLKGTHGSGFNLFCTDKAAFDWPAAKQKMDHWLKQDISYIAGETHYSEVPPRIICEEHLGDENGNVPDDYKLFCFNGKVHCTMVCTDRFAKEGVKFDFFDSEFAAALPYGQSAQMNKRIVKPEGYDRMKAVAEILSRPFPFVRVDFYDVNGRVVFGELTFTPNGCVDRDYTESAQRTLGGLISLPDKLV
jgi:hypothetical protein